MMRLSNPIDSVRKAYYFRRAYSKFQSGVDTARKEDAFSPRKREAPEEIGKAIKYVDRALEEDSAEVSDFEAGIHFVNLTDGESEPVNYNEFKEYFEELEGL